jgi:hypothetical protein
VHLQHPCNVLHDALKGFAASCSSWLQALAMCTAQGLLCDSLFVAVLLLLLLLILLLLLHAAVT